MGQLPTNNNPKSNQIHVQNFLESLREKGLSDRIPLTGSLEKLTRAKEIQKHRVSEFHKARASEWHSVYSSKEKQTQKQIEELRMRFSALTKEVNKLQNNLARVDLLPIAKPGEYHRSLFELFITALENAQKEVSLANNWLELYKQKSKKQGYYWNQAAKQGSSFFLNKERQVATAVS